MSHTPQCPALLDMCAERRRQIEQEGFDKAHDDAHVPGELARAGATYAWLASLSEGERAIVGANPGAAGVVQRLWPWELHWLKLKDPRREMVIAGALILAELERKRDRNAVDDVAAARVSTVLETTPAEYARVASAYAWMAGAPPRERDVLLRKMPDERPAWRESRLFEQIWPEDWPKSWFEPGGVDCADFPYARGEAITAVVMLARGIKALDRVSDQA